MLEYLDAFDTRAKSRDGEWVDLFVPGTVHPAVHPVTGARFRVKVIGPDNPERQDLIDEINRRTARMQGLSPDGMAKNDALWRNQHEVFAAAVKGWEGFEEPCTPENVARVFDKVRGWFLQVDSFSSGRAAFLPSTGNGGSGASGDGPKQG